MISYCIGREQVHNLDFVSSMFVLFAENRRREDTMKHASSLFLEAS